MRRESVEYKYVVVAPDGSQEWQDGPNKEVSATDCSSLEVTDSWEADGPRTVAPAAAVETVETPQELAQEEDDAPPATKDIVDQTVAEELIQALYATPEPPQEAEEKAETVIDDILEEEGEVSEELAIGEEETKALLDGDTEAVTEQVLEEAPEEPEVLEEAAAEPEVLDEAAEEPDVMPEVQEVAATTAAVPEPTEEPPMEDQGRSRSARHRTACFLLAAGILDYDLPFWCLQAAKAAARQMLALQLLQQVSW